MPDLPSDRPIRVAMAGAGYFGAFHYDAWGRMPEVELVAICDINPSGAAELAAKYGAPGAPLPIFTDAAEMAEAARPDIVDIAAPPQAHLSLLGALAPRVGHIVCQKPFGQDLAEARAAVALAAQYSCRVAVHENFRFQPWHREARRLIETGALGELYQVAFRLRPGDGQGPRAYLDRQPYFQTMPRLLVHETAIHLIDTFRFLMGEATGVFARLVRLNPVIAGEDAGVIYFDFQGGRRGVFDGNRLADHAAENRRRTLGEMLIEGSAGTLRLDGDGRLWLRAFGSNEEAEQRFEWRDHLYAGDCVYLTNRSIFEAWRAGRSPETEASLYLRNIEIEEAVYQSAEDGAYKTV